MNSAIADIQWLREETGVGLMAAKQALASANGDRQAAVTELRKSGTKVAAAKSSRTVRDGRVAIRLTADKKTGVIISVACETDFVARTDDFTQFVSSLAEHALATAADGQVIDPARVLAFALKGMTGQQLLESTVTKLGENIQLTGARSLTSTDLIGEYLHGSKKIGALVALKGTTNVELAHDVAMQITAMNPQYVSPATIPADVRAQETAVYEAQLQAEGKPAELWPKILPGKFAKFERETCLVKQPFVKDDSVTIEKLLGPKVEVLNFIRQAVS